MLPDSRRSAQSRMKCRKVLGLGESADGHIPKSKISQLLGHDHLNHIVIEQGNYPRGLRYFQWATCLMFGVVGLVNIFFPQHFYRTSTPNSMDPGSLVRQLAKNIENLQSSTGHEKTSDIISLEEHVKNLEQSMVLLEVPVRLFGVACVSLFALFLIVSVINSDNRRAIRIALIVEALYFIIGILVTVFTTNPLSTENTSWLTDPTSMFWITAYKVFGVLLCVYYYHKTSPSKHSSYTG